MVAAATMTPAAGDPTPSVASAAGEVVPFIFNTARVRVVVRDGAPWFVAADVCKVLDIGNARQAATRLDDDEKHGVTIRDAIGRDQKMTAVNESGLWSLVLTSRKPEAKLFRKWVTGEVIPAIRRTGSYGRAPAIDMRDPAQLRLAAAQLMQLTAELAPKAAALDLLAAADGTRCLSDGAKVLKQSPGRFFAYLHAHGWIFRRGEDTPWVGSQSKVDAGLLTHAITTVTRRDGSAKAVAQVRITPKGLTRLALDLGIADDGRS